MTVLGVSLVVAIFVMVLALANGLSETIVSAGAPDNVLVFGTGTMEERESSFTRKAAAIMKALSGVQQSTSGEPCVSPEVVMNPIISKKSGKEETWTTVRGVQPVALAVHDQVRITEGRMLQSGLAEIVIGRSCARELGYVNIGEQISFGSRKWLIVGIFEAQGTKFESEIWADVNVLLGDFHRNRLGTVTIKLADASKSEEFIQILEKDPRLKVKAFLETAYLKEETETATAYRAMGLAVAFILACGALFGAMNTMYAAVGGRVREIATLRALGFSQNSILLSFVIESVLISFGAGVMGCLLALLANGISLTTMNLNTMSNLTFALRVTPGIFFAGMLFSIVIGIAGGLLPASQAARLSITEGLRKI